MLLTPLEFHVPLVLLTTEDSFYFVSFADLRQMNFSSVMSRFWYAKINVEKPRPRRTSQVYDSNHYQQNHARKIALKALGDFHD